VRAVGAGGVVLQPVEEASALFLRTRESSGAPLGRDPDDRVQPVIDLGPVDERDVCHPGLGPVVARMDDPSEGPQVLLPGTGGEQWTLENPAGSRVRGRPSQLRPGPERGSIGAPEVVAVRTPDPVIASPGVFQREAPRDRLLVHGVVVTGECMRLAGPILGLCAHDMFAPGEIEEVPLLGCIQDESGEDHHVSVRTGQGDRADEISIDGRGDGPVPHENLEAPGGLVWCEQCAQHRGSHSRLVTERAHPTLARVQVGIRPGPVAQWARAPVVIAHRGAEGPVRRGRTTRFDPGMFVGRNPL
jgi:hypothetical protein